MTSKRQARKALREARKAAESFIVGMATLDLSSATNIEKMKESLRRLHKAALAADIELIEMVSRAEWYGK